MPVWQYCNCGVKTEVKRHGYKIKSYLPELSNGVLGEKKGTESRNGFWAMPSKCIINSQSRFLEDTLKYFWLIPIPLVFNLCFTSSTIAYSHMALLGTIHLRRRQIFTIFDPYLTPSAVFDNYPSAHLTNFLPISML